LSGLGLGGKKFFLQLKSKLKSKKDSEGHLRSVTNKPFDNNYQASYNMSVPK